MGVPSPLSPRLTVAALLTLTAVTGLVDAVSYLRLGHVFVANMTGNVVFLGFTADPHSGLSLAASLTAIGGFVVGAMAGGQVAHTLAAAISAGRSSRNRWPALRTTCSRASGMQRARMRPLTSGTIGSSSPASTSVGCWRRRSHGRLVQPVMAYSWPRYPRMEGGSTNRASEPCSRASGSRRAAPPYTPGQVEARAEPGDEQHWRTAAADRGAQPDAVDVDIPDGGPVRRRRPHR